MHPPVWATALLPGLGLGLAVDAKIIQLPGASGTVSVHGGTCTAGEVEVEVDSFFSIPYAEPPVGALRWAAPRPWSASSCSDSGGGRGNGVVINATVPAPACIQFGTEFAEAGPQSEDCLYLNIWAPAHADPSSGLPVKVWVYGGSNEGGGVSNPTYDGCGAAADSVVVSLNYRLGPLGYLALTDLGLRGNYGIRDLLLGLEWVQRNIRSFGGDPTKVLLFGESAGATNTFTLASLPGAPKLMRVAAMESGGGRDLATVAAAQTFQKIFLHNLNCSTPDHLACLRAATPAQLQAAHAALPGGAVLGTSSALNYNGSRSAWGPLVDGAVIPTNPRAAGVKVPAILGSNANEGALFVLGTYGAAATSLGREDYDIFLTSNFGPQLAPRVNETYPLAAFNGSVAAAMSTVVTAASYECPAHRGLLGAASNRKDGGGVPVWTYRFAHAPTCAWYQAIPAEYVGVLGATHTAEIPFVFNMTRNLPPPDGACAFSEAEVGLARAMSRAWTNMAEFGTPDGADDDAAWPAWTPDRSLGVVFGSAPNATVVNYKACEFWDRINEALNDYAGKVTL